MKDIQKLAYELYKIDWKQSHMITPQVEKDALKDYYEGLTNSDFDDEFNYEEYIDEFGYDGQIYACYDEFLDSEFQDKEYMRSLIDDNKLYMEYLSIVSPGKDKQVIMETTFNATLFNGDNIEKYILGEKGYIDVGGFSVIAPEYSMRIPFDFEATTCILNDDGSITFGNFDAFLERIYDVDPCHEEDWAENGLAKEDITAKLLASADYMDEFYFNVANHNDRDVLAFLEVKEMSFTNEKDETYYVKPEVLMRFNRLRVAEQVAELMMPNEFYKVRQRLAEQLVQCMSDKDPKKILGKISVIQNDKLYASTEKREIADFLINSMIKLSSSKDDIQKDAYNIYTPKTKKSFGSLLKDAGEKQLSQHEEKGNIPVLNRDEEIRH